MSSLKVFNDILSPHVLPYRDLDPPGQRLIVVARVPSLTFVCFVFALRLWY
jgi:hypothetical protein